MPRFVLNLVYGDEPKRYDSYPPGVWSSEEDTYYINTAEYRITNYDKFYVENSRQLGKKTAKEWN